MQNRNNNTGNVAYQESLFNTDHVHKINIEISDTNWNDLLTNPLEKTKYRSNAIIDDARTEDVSFSTKGTTSLTEVAASGSSKYSFKVNFGKYVKNQTYQGLDKLNLNNIFSDATYMKDYIVYYIMRDMGVEAPLVSYAKLKINNEPHGLYLAIEDIDNSFLERYNNKSGVLYKPEIKEPEEPTQPEEPQKPTPSDNPNEELSNPQPPSPPAKPSTPVETAGADLVYIDDDISSYDSIFDNAVNNPSISDKERLILALKALNTNNEIEKYWDIELHY